MTMVLRSRDTQNNGQAVCVLFVRTATLTTYFGKDGIIRAVHFLPAKMKNGPTPFSAQNLYDLFPGAFLSSVKLWCFCSLPN